jgi:Zn-dependent protease with chaperone function
MASLFGMLALPLLDTFGRTLEGQADRYSLETENRPDALSSALVKAAEYRLPAARRARGDHLLRPPFGRTPGACRDGAESRASAAAGRLM